MMCQLTGRSVSLVLSVAILGVLLSGCAGTAGSIATSASTTADASPHPAPSPPLSPEEALSQAIEVVREYNRVTLSITADPSVDASVLRPYATEERVDEVRAHRHRLEQNGQRLVGLSRYTNQQIQDYNSTLGHLVLLACEDISDVRLIDLEGADVTPSARKNHNSTQITIALLPEGMKVEESILWDGADVC